MKTTDTLAWTSKSDRGIEPRSLFTPTRNRLPQPGAHIRIKANQSKADLVLALINNIFKQITSKPFLGHLNGVFQISGLLDAELGLYEGGDVFNVGAFEEELASS